ncbi:MAG TPA: AMP-binding protein [Acidimicrobiia bacterium]|nr:AMP-binding protein [Acidimicrobiia bacterium]
MTDWSFAGVWHGIAAAAPDREAVVCGDRRITFGQFDDRARRLAWHLVQEAELERGDKVAIDLVNCPEYLETFFAALKLGCVPVNVNYRYLADEVHYIVDNADAKAVVHGPAFADTVKTAVERIQKPWRPFTLQSGEQYEAVLAAAPPATEWEPAHRPSGDDLIFVYTGGTTGMPKGVMWRSDDLYVSLWRMGRPGTDPPDPIAAVEAGKRAGTCLPACPLMHGTGLFITLSTLSGGGAVVLVEEPGLDPARVWSEVERNAAEVLTIVGDVFARPLLAALDTEPTCWDLSSLRAITSSGVTWSPETKAGLLRHLPKVTLLDSLGATEGMASRQAATADDAEIKPARFAVDDRVKVFREDTGTEVTPGSDEIGLLAVGGRIPLGYWGDPDKTRNTFKVIDGRRYAVAGDYAQVDADGTIRLLGRGSACINTGGEKVYPEEVELVLREHPGVFDCVAVGVPDDRFGEIVVALVQVTEGHTLDEAELAAWCRRKLAGYKKPRRFLFVDSLERNAAGKANYQVLRRLAADRLAS